jgi:hypothetical protein
LMDFNGDSFPDLFLCMSDSPDRVLLNDGRAVLSQFWNNLP